MKNYIMPFAVALLLVGCNIKPVSGPVSLDQEFSLKVDQSVSLQGGMTIRLDSIPRDSRCPTSVDCVWMGTAEVALTVTPASGAPSFVRLYTSVGDPARFPTDTLVAGYRITLVDDKPYPTLPGPIPQKYYVAVLKVSK
jgi:hypothetical protein